MEEENLLIFFIEKLVEEHRPHVFALGEANIMEDHNRDGLVIKNYDLHLTRSIDNPDMKDEGCKSTHKSLQEYSQIIDSERKK